MSFLSFACRMLQHQLRYIIELLSKDALFQNVIYKLHYEVVSTESLGYREHFITQGVIWQVVSTEVIVAHIKLSLKLLAKYCTRKPRQHFRRKQTAPVFKKTLQKLHSSPPEFEASKKRFRSFEGFKISMKPNKKFLHTLFGFL